jgi:hypothetical protein
MNHGAITDHLIREERRVSEVRRKRYVVFFDHLKTTCFGFIGAACINPLVNQLPFNTLAYGTIVVCGGILGAMVIWPNRMR